MTMPKAAPSTTYGRPHNGRLYVDGAVAPPVVDEVHSAFRALIHDEEFPCLGAKSIANQLSYRFGLYQTMNEVASTQQLLADLYRFIQERDSIQGDFTSFIACFREPKVMTPKQFEGRLWQQLLELHKLDSHHHSWAEGVSSDPSSVEFSFSIGGQAFFIVGLSPNSERWARRFPWPLIVFNDHGQFERLREQNRFERLKNQIRERDTKLHGVPNEMLTDFGAHSEARQYAGRQVGPQWQCPVHFGSPEESVD
jgi:FPC/CPF motif-containing protein YcgG